MTIGIFRYNNIKSDIKFDLQAEHSQTHHWNSDWLFGHPTVGHHAPSTSEEHTHLIHLFIDLIHSAQQGSRLNKSEFVMLLRWLV